ncbi:hypothetical protein IFM12275_64920 [Nocardia sputorum]|uniref:Uncharacterized protein n=1 Tax=Nocardia sputorum TaxID=2984338 RepID=A0ABN6TZA9_9NOCA|nr:hypothetical protein IFM12275_64920 [Nocardia sputorum]BDT98268.1 hypothetical protein IFM12276_12970 [Nocardia sputorum]
MVINRRNTGLYAVGVELLLPGLGTGTVFARQALKVTGAGRTSTAHESFEVSTATALIRRRAVDFMRVPHGICCR